MKMASFQEAHVALCVLVAAVDSFTAEEEAFITEMLHAEGYDTDYRSYAREVYEGVCAGRGRALEDEALTIIANVRITDQERVIAWMLGTAMVTKEEGANPLGIDLEEYRIIKDSLTACDLSFERVVDKADELDILARVERARASS